MDAVNHKCPNCKGDLPFNPVTGRWDCPFCGSSFSLEDLNISNANPNVKEGEVHEQETVTNVYKCEACGAEMITDENTVSTFCVYCGSTGIIKNRLRGEFKPHYVIPFKTTKEDAMKAYPTLKKGKWFVPDNFFSKANVEKITGVYIPFWLYDARSRGYAIYDAENTSSWSDSDYIYTKHDIYQVLRDGELAFSKVPCDASKKFDDNLMDTIEPFDYKELTSFNMSYLSGFLAEKYDVTVQEDQDRATYRMGNTLLSALEDTIGHYSKISRANQDIKVDFGNVYYALFPVWMLRTKYKDKFYEFAMNGQTGKMVGDVPCDMKKFWRIFFMIFGASSALIFLITYLINYYG